MNNEQWAYSASVIFKKLRGEMTLKAASERSGISISQWADIENGRSQPSLETLEKASRSLGKVFAMVLYDKDEDLD